MVESFVYILIDIPETNRRHAEYVFTFFMNWWGVRCAITSDPNRCLSPQLVYSQRVNTLRISNKIEIPFDGVLYDPQASCESKTLEALTIWGRSGAVPEKTDLIASTFRLLTMTDEKQIEKYARDSNGGFLCKDLPSPRRATVDIPFADNHAALLFGWLCRVMPSIQGVVIPRWPNNRKFVVCLSHDTDAVHMGHPRELLTFAAKLLVRGRRVYANMFSIGWRHRHRPSDNPFWGFPDWQKLEMERSTRSCFYLAVSPQSCRRRLNDCKSDVLLPGIDWGALRALHERGWEFGLHAALGARDHSDELVLEKQAIEDRLGARIYGIRHHYLAFDNLRPYRTFRKQITAGFIYDTSVGWRDRAGFRAGTCLPWYPFDPETGRTLTLVELPLCLMDGHVMCLGGDDAVKECLRIGEYVRQAGGVLMLNWHTETICNQYLYTGYREVFCRVLNHYGSDSEAWFATPLEVASWWRKRSEEFNQHNDVTDAVNYEPGIEKDNE